MKSRFDKWMMLLAVAAAAGATQAQTRVAGNPLDALPQINAPKKGPNVTVQVAPQAPQLQELLSRHLTPTTFQVEGVKSVPFEEISRRFTPLVGKDITIGELIETANGVTKLYQERGYALSFAFIPAQTFDNGVVRVTVVEGYVSDVKVTGKPGAMESKIRAIAAHITADRPLRRATFERYVNTFGLLPGVSVKANVPPPQTTDGATTLELNVERKAFNISSGIDFNHPGVQGLITATENGLTSFGEQLSISALVPPGRDKVTYVAFSGAVPVGSSGLVTRLDASTYRGKPTDNPGLPSYVERTVKNEKLGLSASYPLLLNNQRSLLGTVSGYASHNEDRYQNQITGATLENRSQVRVLQMQLDYTSVGPKQVRKLSVNVAKGFDILGASKSQDITVGNTTTSLPSPISLTFVRTGATYTQTNEWPFRIGTSVSLTGQYSPDSLPTSEQISFGAQRYALGYQPGETSGDSGWGMSLEVNRAFSPGWTYLKTITPYVAYDMARVYLHAGTPQPNRLSSVGIGVRLSDSRYYNLDLSVAKPVGDAPVESASRSPRINAAFSYQLN
ncbi:ShlB/FhaC/HecB family hemolysin secretion/activation protein [Burkholderia stagnalis]|uniref:ShlB/FhaC/HecB family hemolysin secretion/activation protein n=1 Tax=Burkholderia stagnalis TaxID=1503054 RepID=A0ABX9YMX7_9BURK|nr:ShlB/FhaC/HecB family hemolysin secretion/activation protein [Burkholderia stagnalis]KVX62507.1 sugar transporter [Burkholderia stagnalis]RQQ57059.1 ShlB/FhaC/HecB family hemolysin secretion/activation protein [Burkholderia stagnalis]RQQ67746.1 ShlB/FhaC/HecB family hemolysin secretion/activation protein [Burkholderia stagnalis]RQQ75070.1 ShlB/FhaC/HecB family hemolysin secretion/activation protein [Burkholderia stagnalis]RQQ78440.1 ShlB/FhaC/HecB family hemolysin secretion/activation prote